MLVLLHIEVDHRQIMKDKMRQDTGLWQLIWGDPKKYDGPGFVPESEGSWSEVGKNPSSAFNCHAFTLGNRAGLRIGDWVESECTNASMNTNPAGILFDHYAKCRKRFRATSENARCLGLDPDLDEGDIILFTRMTKHFGVAYDHSGLVRKVDGANWMASKFGFGRLLVTPIETALLGIPSLPQQLRTYQFS